MLVEPLLITLDCAMHFCSRDRLTRRWCRVCAVSFVDVFLLYYSSVLYLSIISG